MIARERLNQLKEKFGPAIQRADLPGDSRLFVFVEPNALKAICQYIFRDLDARYVISIGLDQLRRVPEVGGVTNGPGRADAVRAALTGRLLKSLVVDEAGAAAIMAGS